MFSKRKIKRSGHVDSLIGKQTVLQGDVRFSGGLHVDGIIRGNVIADGESDSILTLSDRGTIEGQVKVPHIVLNGAVSGDVHAAQHIELAANARVSGNVYYALIEMAMGAEVNGKLVHVSEADQPVLGVGAAQPAEGSGGG